jgi:hypothetical protein
MNAILLGTRFDGRAVEGGEEEDLIMVGMGKEHNRENGGFV